MIKTQRQPVSVGEMLREEFMRPRSINQTQLAKAMGVQRRLVNELCRDRRAITADTALMLARVFGNSAEFWLSLQADNDLWHAMNDPERRQRVEKAQALSA